MLIRNNILTILLISIFIFPLPAIALGIGNRIRKEAGFTKVELSAMEEMGWSDKRLVKYASIACGYVVDDKSTSLERFYKFYFGNYNPSKEPYIKHSLQKIHDWVKKQPECN
ncbi:hypothetical protein NIES267_41560 [Calothrix parasitica NIES-267]|uniref:Rap1a immunity protein domain-containing protein n=1 Tax=Calothrix parasitica NIES-267 TaxID=1973488 RepID=A0A1Z4LTU2_9CYAN|nr:hypothetical protein NIES267_41560 [Calothrix parasitica NIES-267]